MLTMIPQMTGRWQNLLPWDNLFKEANHVWCFSHTLQHSTKALLAPFNTAISQAAVWDNKIDIEQELVLDGTAEVCKTVTKVHLNFFAFSFIIHYWLLANLTDLMAHIHNHSFNNNCPPCMVMYLLEIQPQGEAYPPWCGNSMELNLQHDAFCIHIQTCNWWHHCWKTLKLRRYELDNDNWVIPKDLISIRLAVVQFPNLPNLGFRDQVQQITWTQTS